MLTNAQVVQAKALKLSENFTLFELISSESYPELVEWPSAEVIRHLTEFAQEVLQPARTKWGAIHVDSGWRNPMLNARIGGVKDSVHQIIYRTVFIGAAADIVPRSAPLTKVFDWAFDNLPIKTAIIYRKPSVTGQPFIHFDTRFGRVGKDKLEKTGPDLYIPYQEQINGR